jgi:hypothetical protein
MAMAIEQLEHQLTAKKTSLKICILRIKYITEVAARMLLVKGFAGG